METLAQVFPINFAKSLRTPYTQNTSGRLLQTNIWDFITKVYWSFQGVQKEDTWQKCVTNLIIIAYRKIMRPCSINIHSEWLTWIKFQVNLISQAARSKWFCAYSFCRWMGIFRTWTICEFNNKNCYFLVDRWSLFSVSSKDKGMPKGK